jgi:hypothetical protein
MAAFSRMRGLTSLVILFSVVDLAGNSIFAPIVSSEVFVLVIFCAVEIVAILFQFFSWFFLVTSLREFRQGGFVMLLGRFWQLFATTGVYLLFFIIDKVILFARMSDEVEIDLYSMWNYTPFVVMWSFERVIAVGHYSLSIYYVMKIFSDPHNFV